MDMDVERQKRLLAVLRNAYGDAAISGGLIVAESHPEAERDCRFA